MLVIGRVSPTLMRGYNTATASRGEFAKLFSQPVRSGPMLRHVGQTESVQRTTLFCHFYNARNFICETTLHGLYPLSVRFLYFYIYHRIPRLISTTPSCMVASRLNVTRLIPIISCIVLESMLWPSWNFHCVLSVLSPAEGTELQQLVNLYFQITRPDVEIARLFGDLKLWDKCNQSASGISEKCCDSCWFWDIKRGRKIPA